MLFAQISGRKSEGMKVVLLLQRVFRAFGVTQRDTLIRKILLQENFEEIAGEMRFSHDFREITTFYLILLELKPPLIVERRY